MSTTRFLFLLGGLAAVLSSYSAVAESLNKCIDAQGKVTYSNLPCKNAREARKVEIDPPPPARPRAGDAQNARREACPRCA